MKKMHRVIKEFTSLEGILFRYSLSYCLLLALLPSLIIAVFIISNSVLTIEELMSFLYQYLPQDLIEPFIDYLMTKDYNSLISLTISLVIACYLASKSFYTLMLIVSKHESFITLKILIRIKSFYMFIVFVVGIFMMLFITYVLGFNLWLSYSVGIVLLFYILYRMVSFEKRPFSYGLLGAVFSGISIIAIGYLFFGLVKEFTSYDNVYGPLSSFVVLLLSIYLISSIIYFGYCLNMVYGSKKQIVSYKSIRFYQWGETLIGKVGYVMKRKG